MTSRSITLPAAITSLAIDDADGTNTGVAGVLPQYLLSHTVEKDFMCDSTIDFMTHGSSSVDFEQLQKDFNKICTDFMSPLRIDTVSKAVEFCSKIIYEVGPQARQVKKTGDKTWKFMFRYKTNGKLVVKVAFVSTYKKEDAQYVMKATDNMITLSVRNASLLAMLTLEKINELALTQVPAVMLLSPLAGAVFSKDDLIKISTEVKAPIGRILNVVNASCQSGGHYLPSSRMHVAAVATIVATRNIKDDKIKQGIIGKTLKQYINQKKVWNLSMFEVYAKYGHGGVPSTIALNKLIMDDIQKISPIAAAKAAHATALTTTVTVPTASTSQSTPIETYGNVDPPHIPPKAAHTPKTRPTTPTP